MYIAKIKTIIMIAKLFKRFSIYSVVFSLFALCVLAYLYSDFDQIWFTFQSRVYNFLVLLGLFIMTIIAIRRILHFSNIESRTHYYLFIYPLVVYSFPIEQFDIRILLCSAFFFSGWASFREYIAEKDSLSTRNSATKLLDSVILVTVSAVLFYENLFLLLFPVLGLTFSKKSISREELGIIFIIPTFILFACYQLVSLFQFNSFLFSSLLSEYYFSVFNTFNISFVYQHPEMIVLLMLIVISIIVNIRSRSKHDVKTLDYTGLGYLFLIAFIIGYSKNSPEMLLHYMALPLTYYINKLLESNKNSFIANFLFILIIISFLLFTFVLK